LANKKGGRAAIYTQKSAGSGKATLHYAKHCRPAFLNNYVKVM
jgi:hypothetical protein